MGVIAANAKGVRFGRTEKEVTENLIVIDRQFGNDYNNKGNLIEM